ncbi:hypothetical protein HOLleu_20174 [Holothuria leucospilota]|uniref:Uncharacterized protein n=1 Tax=Holothuria leucospilota TaxID=206669 RepID=A0A9Q1H7T3_HOLLE|nr:hypothetical protein HOLleu_20174 [Holothuria leucospilota]
MEIEASVSKSSFIAQKPSLHPRKIKNCRDAAETDPVRKTSMFENHPCAFYDSLSLLLPAIEFESCWTEN